MTNERKGDKQVERERYDRRAKALQESGGLIFEAGSFGVRPIYRSPYIKYESLIRLMLRPDMSALELGAGTGNHTEVALSTGALVTASDISPASLEVLYRRYSPTYKNIATKVADLEALPFESNSFDMVLSAGSLSYGDNDLVRDEVFRVLRPGGYFICVDSLKANPIYDLNRYIHYLRGNRSYSTLKRIPSMQVIKNYSRIFCETSVDYFGSLSFFMPVLCPVLGEDKCAEISDSFDSLINVRRSAFKFVMCAKKGKVGNE